MNPGLIRRVTTIQEELERLRRQIAVQNLGMNMGVGRTLTIAAGAVTAYASFHILESEIGASDDLDTINGELAGKAMLIRSASGHAITIKDGTGNIVTDGGDIILDSTDQVAILFYDDNQSNWVALSGASGTPSFTYLDLPEQPSSPTPPADVLRLWSYDQDGFSTLVHRDENAFVTQLGRDRVLIVYNNTGVTLSKTAAVYISGADGIHPTVALADGSDPAKMPVQGIVVADIPDASYGRILIEGAMVQRDTSAWMQGDLLWLDTTTPGALTSTEPVSGIKQKVAYVLTSDPIEGKLYVISMTDDTGGGGGVTDHGALTGLGDDDHTQYLLLAGRAGGQTGYGGTGAGETLTLAGTPHATKGLTILEPDGGRVAIGKSSATFPLEVFSGAVGIATVIEGTAIHTLLDIQNLEVDADTAVRFRITGDSWLAGVDGGDGDKFKIAKANSFAAGTGQYLSIDTTGKTTAQSLRVTGAFNLAVATPTIVTGAITATAPALDITAEGGAADNLDTISGGVTGDIIIIRNVTATPGTNTITVRDSVDNLALKGGVNAVLDAFEKYIWFIRTSARWIEISRSF